MQPVHSHKDWHSRGYLPHFDRAGLVQVITFHLGDSLPADLVAAWQAELDDRPEVEREAELRRRVGKYLDAGHGGCYLGDDRVASLVEGALLHFDAERYRLLAWVVMPNHVHAIIETFLGHPLGDVIHSWKSFTAKQANRILRREGEFWMPDYFDRFIRDERHLQDALRYIHWNPVRAGLVKQPEDWPYSSASWQRRHP